MTLPRSAASKKRWSWRTMTIPAAGSWLLAWADTVMPKRLATPDSEVQPAQRLHEFVISYAVVTSSSSKHHRSAPCQ